MTDDLGTQAQIERAANRLKRATGQLRLAGRALAEASTSKDLPAAIAHIDRGHDIHRMHIQARELFARHGALDVVFLPRSNKGHEAAEPPPPTEETKTP